MLVLIACGGPAIAQNAVKTGAFTATIDKRSALTDPDALSRVTGWTRERLETLYP